MCCPTKVCCFCMCLILVVIAIGLLFGFGVFEHGFHKLKDSMNACDPSAVTTAAAAACGRPFLGFTAPPPFQGSRLRSLRFRRISLAVFSLLFVLDFQYCDDFFFHSFLVVVESMNHRLFSKVHCLQNINALILVHSIKDWL